MFNVFKPKEKFLIFTVTPAGGEGVVVDVDEDKHLRLRSAESRFKLPKFLDKLYNRRVTTVINIHPSLGAIRIIPFRFIRQTQNAPLAMTELENFLAQLAQKAFLEFRNEVAEELKTEELDVILVDSRPFAYRANGSSVNSPLGHKSREIHGFLELLFTLRGAFELMQPILYSGLPVFMTLRDKSELMSLNKLGHARPAFLECGEDDGARLLRYGPNKKKEEIFSRKYIDWSPARFFVRLEELWNVARPVAAAIYSECLKNNLSPKLKIQIEKIWKKEITELFSALKRAGVRGEVYLKSFLPLPLSFPARGKGIVLKEFPFRDLFSCLGFEFDEKLSQLPPNKTFAQLAPFLECYYDNSDPAINHSLRRRIHWLIT